MTSSWLVLSCSPTAWKTEQERRSSVIGCGFTLTDTEGEEAVSDWLLVPGTSTWYYILLVYVCAFHCFKTFIMQHLKQQQYFTWLLLSGARRPSWFPSLGGVGGTEASEGDFTPGVKERACVCVCEHSDNYNYIILLLLDIIIIVVSPEMEVLLLRGWVEPDAEDSSGGVDRPQ